MDANTIATYTGLDIDTIEGWLEMPGNAIYKASSYRAEVERLNRTLLDETLPEVRAAYQAGLPALRKKLTDTYGVDADIMTPETLGTWVVKMLRAPHTVPTVVNKHDNVPIDALKDGLADILTMVSHIPQGSKEWQKALCLLVIPMMSK